MKTRPSGFLSEDNIAHDSEIFDYIRELHEYLWRYVRLFRSGASGSLSSTVDAVLDDAESKRTLL